MKPTLVIFVLCGLVDLFSQSTVTTTTIPPQEKDLSGTWIGFDNLATTGYRIILKENGGQFAYSYSGHPVHIFKIVTWSSKQGKIVIRTQDLTAPGETIELEGFAQKNRLDLTIKGSSGWYTKIGFLREAIIELRIKELRTAMRSELAAPTNARGVP